MTLLDRQKLNAVMYDAEPVADALVDCFANTGAALGVYEYELDSRFSTATITGFCPEQTARARLLWIVFAIGGYVLSSFHEKIRILPIDSAETLIPMDKTYWRPQVTNSDYVTAVKAKYYTFSEGTPQTTDKWVQDADGTTYIVTESEMSLSNPAVPLEAPENIISIDGVYLLNSENVSDVLSHLSTLYFKRMSVEMDVIDNAEFLPGDRVLAYTGQESMIAGYIESADFAFGHQAKASLKIIGAESLECASLTIAYLNGGDQLDRKEYLFPVGYVYGLPNPFFDQIWNTHRYVFRPATETVTGTMSAEGNTETVQYTSALDLNLENRELEIISVDELSVEDGVVSIG